MENWNSFNATISDEDSSIVMAQLLGDHNPSFGMQTMVWSGHDVCLEDDANFSSSYLWSQEPHLASYYSMDGDKMSLIGNSTSIGNDLIDTSTAKRKLDIGRNEEDVLPVESLNKKPRISKKVERSCSFSSESESNSSKQSSGMTLNCKTRASKGTATDPQSLYARKRRERINQRLRILQTLVPNGTKVDISTMLEEAVQYVKFLQLQIKLLSSDELWMYAPFAYNGMNTGLDLKIFPPEK